MNEAEEEIPRLNSPAMTQQYKKINCWSWTCAVLAVVFASLTIATPFVMNNIILKGAAKQTSLTEANENNWNGVPGYYNLTLDWYHYMYNVTNFDDVKSSANSRLGRLHGCKALVYGVWPVYLPRIRHIHKPILDSGS